MILIEVFTPEGKWIPMVPARQQGLPFNDVRVAPCAIRVMILLAKLGLKSPTAQQQIVGWNI
jgi:hypothetical protein